MGFTMAFCTFWRGVNLKCIGAYAVLEWASDMKLHVFATKHKANTYSEKLIHSDDCLDLELTPHQIYDVIWNTIIFSIILQLIVA
jgi:prolipoprotein diacylglyceryltransferase